MANMIKEEPTKVQDLRPIGSEMIAKFNNMTGFMESQILENLLVEAKNIINQYDLIQILAKNIDKNIN